MFALLRSNKKAGVLLILSIPCIFFLFRGLNKFQILIVRKEKETPSAPPLVVGVSFAQNEPFESSGKTIQEKMLSLGLADRFHLFNRSDLVQLYPEHAKQLMIKSRIDTGDENTCQRVACVIHKPLTVLWAMTVYPPGTWIFWTDSTQYFPGKAEKSVKRCAEILDQMGIDAIPGAPLCRQKNRDHGLVHDAVFKGMDLDTEFYRNAPHYQNSFFMFRNTPKHRAFMEEWLKWLQNQAMVARSHTEDQGVFSMLVTKHQIPALHFCWTGQNYDRHYHPLKDRDNLVNDVIQAWNKGTPMRAYPHAEFMDLWRQEGWAG